MTESRPAAAIVVMLIAMSLLPVGDTLTKLTTGHYPPLQTAWMRYAVQATVIVPLALVLHGRGALLPRPLGMQALRGVLLAAATLLFVTALGRMPVADAMATTFVFPFIVTALSPLVLGEQVGARRWTAVAVGFAGAMLVIQPGSIRLGSGALFALGAAVSYAGYVLLTRRLSASAPPLVMLVLTATVGVISLGLMVPSVWEPVQAKHIPLIAAMGLCNAGVHLMIITAMRWGEASLITPLAYFQIVGGTALGYAVFGDVPEPLMVLGVAVIIASGIYIAWRERKARISPNTPPLPPGRSG